jgi:hypothetical protein
MSNGSESTLKRNPLSRISKTALLVVVASALVTTSALAATAVKNTPKTKPAAASAKGVPQAPFTKDFFGMSVGADLTLTSENEFDNQMNLMKKVGVHWVRALIPWALVEHDNANDDNWILVDRLVNMVEAEGMELLGIIDNPPKWAEQNVPNLPTCVQQPPFDVNAYANFTAKVAARYGHARFAAIELENAPNLPGGAWDAANPCAYTRLMQASYTQIKAVDPGITVLTAGLGAQRNDETAQAGDVFWNNMFTFGAAGYYDVLSWHPYSYPCFPSASCPKDRPWYRIDTVRQAMIDHGDGAKQIWATEFGAPTNGQPGDGHQDENNQAAMMVDAMKHWAALPFAGPFFAFTFRDYGKNPNDKSDWFGLQSFNGKYKKLSFYTFQYESTSKSNVAIPPNVLAGVPHA